MNAYLTSWRALMRKTGKIGRLEQEHEQEEEAAEKGKR
jgi:hypothetical protein